MPNLLQHTLDTLKYNNRSQKDVEYCETENGWFTWKEFVSLADVSYNRIGSLVIPDLKIVGKDFIMTWTNDGDDQEWWFMELKPDKHPLHYKPISLLAS